MRDARQIQRDWALFLDLDGTLLDIALRPEAVAVPRELPSDLDSLRAQLGGALAVVTGRELAVLDGLLTPFRAAGAGEHGAVVRMPDGVLTAIPSPQIPRIWLHQLDRAAERWQGIVIERKPRSVVAHYRMAPERAAEIAALVHNLPGLEQEGFIVLPARMAFEVKPKGSSKARAVALLMETEPFAGRTPVFVGDDITDEAGIDMATRLGGFGLRVGDAFAGEPARVRDWIAQGTAMAA